MDGLMDGLFGVMGNVPVIYIILVVCATMLIIAAAVSEDDLLLMFWGLVACTLMLIVGIGVYGINYSPKPSWLGGEAVVRTVFTEDGYTLLLTNSNKVFRCVVPDECGRLARGDHVTFERLLQGSVVVGTPDIRHVAE